MPASKWMDYQRYAMRCLQEAHAAADSRHKAFLIEMAQAWRRLAEQATSLKSDEGHLVSEADRGD